MAAARRQTGAGRRWQSMAGGQRRQDPASFAQRMQSMKGTKAASTSARGSGRRPTQGRSSQAASRRDRVGSSLGLSRSQPRYAQWARGRRTAQQSKASKAQGTVAAFGKAVSSGVSGQSKSSRAKPAMAVAGLGAGAAALMAKRRRDQKSDAPTPLDQTVAAEGAPITPVATDPPA